MTADHIVSQVNQSEDINQEAGYGETMDFIKNLTKFGFNLGLKRIRSLMARMGNPHNNLKIVHIGGTNGKGSTTAMLQAILQQAGYRAGMFISPHLHDYRERISINGRLIAPEDIVTGISEMRPILEEMVKDGLEHPTEFEVSTALALCYFAKEKPDYVLLEVGLGGAIDSTNIVTPLVSVLTSIGMDHMDYLGPTIEQITRVKAGIIKQGVPVVTSAGRPECLKIIEEYAGDKKAKLVRVGQDVYWEKIKGQTNCFTYYGLKETLPEIQLSLYGEHQFVNAATALAVCEILRDDYGARITSQALREGLKAVKWPGRLELISQNPKVLLDGAHNVDGMKSLVQALHAYAEGPFQRKRLLLCLGMLGDKEIEKAVELIVPLADEVLVTKPDSPRAGNWEYVGRQAAKYLDSCRIHFIEDPVQAVRQGLAKLEAGDMLCVTGSLYMLAPVRKYLLDIIPT